MDVLRLTPSRARVLQALYANPLTADTISGLEDAYKETMTALGRKGRLSTQFMIDLDRKFEHGLYTIKYRLSLYVDKDTCVDLGEITGVQYKNDELRLDVVDKTVEFAVVLKAEVP